MRWVRHLAVAIIVLSAVEFLVATTGVQIRHLPARTDFASYYLAGQLARAHRSPYDPAVLAAAGRALGFEFDQFPFLYPPPFAWAMQPLAHLSYERARQLWLLLGTTALFAALALTMHMARDLVRRLGVQDPRVLWVTAAAFVPAALNSTSVHNDIRSGSVGCMLFLLLALAAWALMERRGTCAGLALAAAAVVKLVPLALLPYAWWRGARRAAGVALGVLVLACVAATLHFGRGIWADWLHFAVVAPLGAPNGWAHNQSLDAYLLRLWMPSAVLVLPAQAPAAQRVLSLVLALAVAAATVWVLAQSKRAAGDTAPSAARLPLEVGLLALALLMLMKITWVHTLAGMLFVWPVLIVTIWCAAERGRAWSRRAAVAACAGFFLSAAHLPILWGTHFAHYPLVILTGAHLAGLLLLWGVASFMMLSGKLE